MELSCMAEVTDRSIPSLNIPGRKHERSHLTLGCLPNKTDLYYLIVKTRKCSVGHRYKVSNNVEKIFSKFVNEGKATIRFLEPPHDLKIQSKVNELRQFIKKCFYIIEGKSLRKSSLFSGVSKVPAKDKTKLVITSQQDLRRASGYPKTLVTLQINDVGLTKIEGNILRLQHLVLLNLEGNKLTCLPPHLDLLQNLKELNVSYNNLGSSIDWRWMMSKNIQEKLCFLDLSCNEIISLSSSVCKFKSLRYLYLNDNKLGLLPNGIGHLSSLRIFEAKNNRIDYLPSSFRFLRLERIDLSGNNSSLLSNSKVINHFCMNPQPSLVDMAAAVVISNRQPFDNETLPPTLVDYLLEANYCMCGSPVFPPVIIGAVPFELSNIASTVLFMSEDQAITMNLIGITFCSNKCRSMAYYNNLLIVSVPC